MARRMRRLGMVVFSGSMVTASPLLAACGGGGPTFDEWAATDGAAGRINLEEVQEAFKISESATDFERRVNEIYEGDGIIYIRARQDGDALTLEGWEDLNNNNEIDDAQDDLLFSIVKEQEQHTMQGHHANGYYQRPFGGGDFLFTYLLLSSFSRGPYFYHTPSTRTYNDTTRTQRTNYRQSSRYTNQVSKNSKYFNNQKTFAGSRYQQSGRDLSPGRRTYQQTQSTSGAFKQSGAVQRTKEGTVRAGGSSGGGARGGGGLQVVIGNTRRRRIR